MQWAPSISHPTCFIQPLIHYFKTLCALFPLRPSASCLIPWMRLMPCWMRRRPELSASPDSVMLWDKRISLFTLSLTPAFKMLINLYFSSYWKLTSRRGVSKAQSMLQYFTRTLACAYSRTHRISEYTPFEVYMNAGGRHIHSRKLHLCLVPVLFSPKVMTDKNVFVLF